MTDHTQVAFRTMRGEMSTVDEGLEGIMTTLRDRGIDTQYSCEGTGGVMDQGYILMPMLSHWRFRRAIRGTEFSKRLRDYGERRFEMTSWREKRTRQITFRSGPMTAYSVEHLIGRRFGLRVCICWPAEETHLLRDALT